MRIALLVPATDPAYAYSRALAPALCAAGHDATMPDLADPSATALNWGAFPESTIPVFGATALTAYTGARPPVALIADAAIPERAWPLLRGAACVIATSEGAAERLAAECGASRIHVVAPGTPNLPRSDGPLAPEKCHVVAVVSTREGAETAMRALARLPDLEWTATILDTATHPDITALDPEAPCLATRAATLGIADRTEFVATHRDALWHRAGVCLLANDDSANRTLEEVLRRGIPVAVAADASITARVPAAAGVIAGAETHESLSKALRRIIFDRAVRHAMADAACKHGRTLPDWTAQAKRFAAALEQA